MAAFLCSAAISQQTANPSPVQATPPAPQTAKPQTAPPQPGQAPAGDDNPTIIKLPVNEVNLIFTVTDKHGHYIPNLQQSDFALLDDQKAPAA